MELLQRFPLYVMTETKIRRAAPRHMTRLHTQLCPLKNKNHVFAELGNQTPSQSSSIQSASMKEPRTPRLPRTPRRRRSAAGLLIARSSL